MSSLNHGRYKTHREFMGTRENPRFHQVDLLAYSMRPGNNINPHTRMTHFVQAVHYHRYHPLGRVHLYRTARAQHVRSTCGLGIWPAGRFSGPIGFLP